MMTCVATDAEPESYPPLAIDGGPPTRQVPFPAWPVVEAGDVDAVAQVVRSGVWGSLHGGGPVSRFEEAFAAYLGARRAVCIANGTQALRVALLASGVGEGDEVIVPAYTFVATATAVLEAGAIPVFVDVDRATLNLDLSHVERSIGVHTRAIVPVHFGGLAADMDRVLAIARAHRLHVIEDASHAHGSEWNGKPLGTIGNVGCFSFQSSKNLCAGEGGAIVTNDAELEERVRRLINFGRLEGTGRFEHESFGSNLRLTEMQGALLLSQLGRLDAQTRRRDENGRYLDGLLAKVPGIAPQRRSPEQTRCAYHLYVFHYRKEHFGDRPRAAFLEALRREGIPAEAGYSLPVHRHPVFRDVQLGSALRTYATHLAYRDLHLPAAEEACTSTAVWLPQNVLLADREDMEDVARAVTKIRAHWGTRPTVSSDN